MPSAYEELVARLRRIHAVGEALGHLGWDQEVMMPPGGVEARAHELSALSALSHELFTDAQLGRLLAQAEREETDAKRQALLRETRFAYERAVRVPTRIVEALAQATSRALQVWAEARAKSDFARFQPILGEIVELRRAYAEAVEPDAQPYEALFRDYEPWIPLDETRRNLAALRTGLQPLIDRAARESAPADPFAGREWPVDAQIAFNKELLKAVGYDFDHGRLDASAHPFSTGNPYDARITTRYDATDPLSGIGSTMHEFGHSLYTLGLPKEDYGTPLGDARDLVVHESQSRLWENHVGRSLAYWEWLLPRMRSAFPGRLDGTTPEGAWRASNVVRPSLIRVEADELTYHMHIALRFEIEEALVSGKLAVDEVPRAWNERVERYLGIAPPDDANGCLQDVHWAHGSLGYFPTYSLGSMLAAQVFEAFARAHPAREDDFRRGDFAPLRGWLRENVHRHGKRHRTDELIRHATGAPLTPDAFLRYARAKFERVWA